jgi:hypothetical protein
MQASTVRALGHVAPAASPRAGAKAVSGKARALATPTLSVRARASANARRVSVRAAAPAAIGSSFARNSALNVVVAKQTELRSRASRTVVKCDASAADRCVTRNIRTRLLKR